VSATPPRTAIHRLAAARVVSVTGSEAAWIALMVAVYADTHSTVWMSAALFTAVGASAIATPLGGALGDRFDRRRVMVASEAVSACVAAVTTAFTHNPSALIGLTLAAAVAQSPYYSASTAAVPNLVPAADLAWANSTVTIGQNTGALLGPLVGGALCAVLAPSAVFAATAACLAVSAIAVASVRGRFADTAGRDGSGHAGVRAGARVVLADPVLRLVTLAWVVLLLMLGPVLVAELPLAHAFGAGATGYGMLVACWGGGGIAGSLLGRRLARSRERTTMIAGCGLIGAGFATVAAAPGLGVALAGMLVAGAAEGAVNVVEQGILQQRTPDAVRSRAAAAIETASLGALAISFPAAGPLIAAAGVRGVYAAAAAGCAASGLVLVPAMRAMRTPPSGLSGTAAGGSLGGCRPERASPASR
jgi:MFS family permease